MYLVGGGPSLVGFPWEKLRGERCLAVCKAFSYVPWAEACYFTDARFWAWYHAELWSFPGRIITAAKESLIWPKYDRLEYVKLTGGPGLETRPGCLRHGNNSGYAAINLAVQWGAREIYLLGYDLRKDGERVHHHPEHPQTGNLEKMGIFFPSIAKPLQETGVRVYNASPESRIEVFPKIRWEDLPCW